MFDVQGIQTDPFSQATESLDDKKGAEKEQFLHLLVAQLKYQDPLNPMEGTEFTAQLAQFSSLEQLFDVNENLDDLQLSQQGLANLQATQFIGKNVVSKGDAITLSEGQQSLAQYQLTGSADVGTVTVFDAFGSIVRMMEQGQKGPGVYSVTWDGKDMNGSLLPDGEYRFQSDFYDKNEEYVASETYQTGTVTGVSFKSGTPVLTVGENHVSMQDILMVQ